MHRFGAAFAIFGPMWKCILLALPFLGMSHTFYYSNTEMVYQQDGGQLQITMRLFVDDVERAIGPAEGTPLRLGDEKQVAGADSLVWDYMQTHFKLSQMGSPIELEWIGFEVEGYDLLWAYMEVPHMLEPRELTVENTVLFEHHEEQVNEISLELRDRNISSDHFPIQALDIHSPRCTFSK